MKNWKRVLAVGASAALMVSMMSGCGNSSTDEDSINSSLDKEAQEAIGSDICETILGVPADTVMATVNGQDITAMDLGYWLSYDINQLTYYYGTDVDWSTAISDDEETTFADYVKEDALNIAVQYALLEQQAAEVSVELSEEDQTTIDETMSNYVESFGESLWEEGVSDGSIVEEDYTDDEKAAWITENGSAEFARNLALYCANEEQLRYLNEVTTLYSLLDDYYYGEEGVALPTDEELLDYADENGYLCSRSILFSTITDADGNEVAFADMTDDQKAQLKTEAQAALDEILAAEDPEATFADKMVNDNDDPGLTAETDCYLYTSGTMVTEYEDAVSALEENEISAELVESEDYGYFIIERLPINVENTTTSGYTLAELYGSNAMSDMIQKWTDEAVVETTEDYDNLDIATIYENLTTLSESLYPTEEDTTQESEPAATEDATQESEPAATEDASQETDSTEE